MAKYEAYTNQPIDWNAKGTKRILQNIVSLLNTFMYEVAYDRTLGRDKSNLDKPITEITPAVIAETYELIQAYEPRARVKEVKPINMDEEGEIVLKVVVEIG